MATIQQQIETLRAELHRHNHNYYVLNAPEITDFEFDRMMRELQDLEQAHPEFYDENSPTMNFLSATGVISLSTQRLNQQLCVSEHFIAR